MSALRRCLAATHIALASLAARWSTSVVAIVSLAAISATMAGVLALSLGVSGMLARTGDPDVAMILSRGAFAEVASVLPNDAVVPLAQAPGLRAAATGAIAREYVATIDLRRRSGGFPGSVVARGLEAAEPGIHARVHVVQGRMFHAGLDEVVVGSGLRQTFIGTDPGSGIVVGERAFKVVGVFDSNGDLHESEIWGDVNQLRAAFGAPDRITSAYARLRDADAYAGFAAYVARQPGNLAVQRESDYYEAQGRRYRSLVLWPGAVLISLMALASLLAVANTIQASIAARIGEIGTLRALGFRRSHILFSLLAEAGLLGACGAAIGAAVARMTFDGLQIAGSNGLNFVPFRMGVSASVLAATLAFTAFVAILAGAIPAIGLLRGRPVSALQMQ